MDKTIHVINASSRTDTGITAELARSLAWCAGPALPRIECLTLADGPNGIVNGRDSDRAAPAVLRHIEEYAGNANVAAFVVACFSDPGVPSAREITRKPVIGIGEAGLVAALALGDRVGTVGVSKGQDAKSLRFARRTGIAERYAGHASLGLDYADLQHPERVTQRLVEASVTLRDKFQAGVIVFAGAGLARYVKGVEEATGLPVVEPTQVAVAIALNAVMQSA